MSTGITLIEPISLPSGAGQDYAGGDVRHVSETIDELSGRAISATTRQLAERDNILAAAVNQLIAAVNNKDQVDNVPLPSVTVPPGESVTVTSLRIPAGFEMRVLNAIVSSSPGSVVRLDILYNQGVYGLLTGTETIISTLDEFTDGTSFMATGELIVRYVNTSGRTAEAVASLMLTQRPVGAQKGGIIGPGAKGERGDRGPQGFAGPAGAAGLPGAAGPAGITYRGTWNGTTSYAQRDTTHYAGSSFYAIAANTGQVPPAPDSAPSAYWDLLARIGHQGAQGVTGAQGPQGDQGPQGPQSSPFYDVRNGLVAHDTGVDFETGTAQNGYIAPSAGSAYDFPWREASIYAGAGSSPDYGVAHLQMVRKLAYRGPLSVTLPTWTDGARGTWLMDDVAIHATMQGTFVVDGTLVPALTVYDNGSTEFTVDVHSADPTLVYLSVTGVKALPAP